MAGRRTGRDRRSLRLPAAAPLVGSAVLVAAVRGVETLWVRLRGVRPTQETTTGARLLHAVLLTGALALAHRAGLPRTSHGTGHRPAQGTDRGTDQAKD